MLKQMCLKPSSQDIKSGSNYTKTLGWLGIRYPLDDIISYSTLHQRNSTFVARQNKFHECRTPEVYERENVMLFIEVDIKIAKI